MQINVLKDGTEGFYLLIEEIFKTLYNNTDFFPYGGCVDDVVNTSQTNYQFTSVIVMHFMNG